MILFSNNASTSLAAACSESDAYIDVLPGTAVLFPVPATNEDYFLVTAKNPNDGAVEIMKVTSVFGDRFNVVRAQEGTTAMAFPQNTIVENRLTAGSLEQLLNDIDATTDTPGRLRIATLAEALAGVVNNAVITPYTLHQVFSDKTSVVPVPGKIPVADENGNMTSWFESIVGKAGVIMPGKLDLLPFKWDKLPQGWYFCNGNRWATGTPQQKALDALDADMKKDFGIDTNSSGTTVPNLFSANGTGYFMRAVDGKGRKPGSIETDAIQEIVGAFSGVATQGPSWSGAMYYTAGPYGFDGTGGHPRGYSFAFAASKVARTATETRPANIGMTPAIFLGV